MVRITSVTSVRGKVRIELDNGCHYILKQGDLVRFPVYADMEMDEETFERRILLCQYPDALNTAVAMLARRACSRKEITDRLYSRKFSDETIRLVVAKLDQQNLLDDRDFSDQWVRYRAGGKYGKDRIYRELRGKGVDEETARDALESVDEDEQFSSALQLAEKAALRKKAGEDIRRVRSRVLQGLIRRGFSWDTARAACDRVFSPDLDD